LGVPVVCKLINNSTAGFYFEPEEARQHKRSKRASWVGDNILEAENQAFLYVK
jgi:hypothetical protein